jgi:hypothetical protein
MARRRDSGRTPSRRTDRAVAATILVCCAALFAAVPAQGAPPAWQRTITLGNGSTHFGAGQGSAVPSSPLILSTSAAAADPEQARLCIAGSLNPGTIAGKTVVCESGTTTPSDKSQTVEAAGGVAMVLINTTAGPLTSDVLAVETIHVNQSAGAAIKAYVAGTATATSSLSTGQRIFADSTTALASSTNPSTIGAPVTFTATVSAGSLDPTGSVAFTAGGTPIPGCASVALAAGQATCTASALSAGAHTIAAGYSGDDGLNPSSGTLTQQVAFVDSTTTLTSSANPAPVGTPVTFTATVGAGSLDPTGSVDFTAGGTLIPGCVSVALAAGQATCTASALGAGAHTIVAGYSGDGKLNPSADTLTQQVALVIVVERPPQGGPPVLAEPAISALQLARCARRSKSGRVRVAMTMQLAQPAPLQILVERAVGHRGRRTCPAPNSLGDSPTRFRTAATVQRGATGAAARRLTLRLRLSPGLYRFTVRAHLQDDALSRPVRGFLRVLK